MHKLCVTSETGRLRSVIIGYPDNFHQVPPAIINETQKQYYFGPDRPTRERIMAELDGFKQVLAGHGVEVLQPEPLDDVPDQLMTRDIGVSQTSQSGTNDHARYPFYLTQRVVGLAGDDEAHQAVLPRHGRAVNGVAEEDGTVDARGDHFCRQDACAEAVAADDVYL